jgi:hypothetical protein
LVNGGPIPSARSFSRLFANLSIDRQIWTKKKKKILECNRSIKLNLKSFRYCAWWADENEMKLSDSKLRMCASLEHDDFRVATWRLIHHKGFFINNVVCSEG